jgi:hypothetical protein
MKNRLKLTDRRSQAISAIEALRYGGISAKTAHNAWYLSQPLCRRGPVLGFRAKHPLDFLKAHACTFERKGKIKKHLITFALLSFRASPSLYGRLN